MKKLLVIFCFVPLLIGQEVKEDTYDIRQFTMTEQQYLALPSILWQSAEQPLSLVATNSKSQAYGGWCLRGKTNGLLLVEIHGGTADLDILAGKTIPKEKLDIIKASPTLTQNLKFWTNCTVVIVVSTNTVAAAQAEQPK